MSAHEMSDEDFAGMIRGTARVMGYAATTAAELAEQANAYDSARLVRASLAARHTAEWLAATLQELVCLEAERQRLTREIAATRAAHERQTEAPRA